MPPDPPQPGPPSPAELIARAKQEAAAKRAEQMLARMQQDDERDEKDGVEPSDSSRSGAGAGLESDDNWNLSGRSSSERGTSQGSSILVESGLVESGLVDSSLVDSGPRADSGADGGSLAGGATMPERSAKSPTTLNVPIDVNPADGELTEAEPRAPRYRPERRPPMATLTACDDGLATGEEVRIRRTPFEVGRVEGDLVIAHDHQMSRRHFRIERRQADEAWEWSLKDLDSLNGTFLRRPSARIDDGDELLIAGEVVRIRHAGDSRLQLTRIGSGTAEERITLDPGVHTIGTEVGDRGPFLVGVPLLAPRHLRLECDRSGRWKATALAGTDGVWLRTPGFRLEDGTQWQTGEQRFVFRTP